MGSVLQMLTSLHSLKSEILDLEVLFLKEDELAEMFGIKRFLLGLFGIY